MASRPPAPADQPQPSAAITADAKLQACAGDGATEQADEMLEGFRRSIDNIDAALIYMLAERFRITQAVGEHKARRRMAPADPARERAQIARLRRLAEEANLDPEFSEKFIRFVIEEVIRHHRQASEGGR
jgi:chorismate mutase